MKERSPEPHESSDGEIIVPQISDVGVGHAHVRLEVRLTDLGEDRVELRVGRIGAIALVRREREDLELVRLGAGNAIDVADLIPRRPY